MRRREAEFDRPSVPAVPAKRRRDEFRSSSDIDVGGGGGEGGVRDARVLGVALWQTVRDAVNKEGRNISLDFLRKPPKRQWPDYYIIIKHPIALEDIKKKLDNNGYATLEAVKADLELCFNNAKEYNQKGSFIYNDAKDLLKLTQKTYKRLDPSYNSDDEKKTPSLHRLLKGRLRKLTEKTDENGRLLVNEFMELPSLKIWPAYYKQIKEPRCLEDIEKRIKKKEYPTVVDFANEVELVFSNALAFNADNSQIYNDALTLRDYFKQLMSDLPEPFASQVPQYTLKPIHNKIKIKMPPAQPQASTSSQPPIMLRVSAPKVAAVKAASPPPPTPPPPPSAAPAPPTTSTAKSKPSPPAPTLAPKTTTTRPPTQSLPVQQQQVAQQPKVATPKVVAQPLPQTNTAYSHYPNASYITQNQIATPTPTAPVPAQILAGSKSPTPQPQSAYQIQTVILKFEPNGRTICLDSRLGVKNWSLRLTEIETGLSVQRISFSGPPDEDDESSEEEEEEEDEEDDGSDDATYSRKRRRTRSGAVGRPPRNKKVKPIKKQPKKRTTKLGEIQVKLNGTVMNEKEDRSGCWSLGLTPGHHTIELGEKDGIIWKVYAVR